VAGGFRLNPERIAELEAGGWRAYYDRNWPRVLTLMVQLNQEQFHIPFPLSVVAALHVARASATWAPVEHDTQAVQRHLARFYRMAQRWSGLRFVPSRAAALELDYWFQHRRLIGEPDKTAFLDALTALHSELFGLPADRVRESARWRVEASNTVDTITGGTSANPEQDWQRLEEQLRACYRSLQQALDTA
jgi:hypothetical protein